MPLPQHLREELGRKRAAEHEAAQRDTRRAFVATAVLCLVWAVVGVGLVLLSFHLADMPLARVAYWGGLLIGNGGVFYTLLAAYRRGENRGDW